MGSVAGVDGFKSGWVAVVLRDGRFELARGWPSLSELSTDLAEVEAIAVDVPIGLPDRNPRPADMEARAFVGPRRSSVFPAPPRAVLEADSFAEGQEVSRELCGRGISRQSWALRDKMLEADDIARLDDRIIEVHPEVTFRMMAGTHLIYAKRTWNGQMQRRALLEGEGIALPADLGDAGHVPVDDVLDAAACAWTANRIARGAAERFPEAPEAGAHIWY